MSSKVSIEVRELGPLRNCRVDIPLRSIVVFYGSNIAGKTLLGLTLATALQVYAVLTRYRQLCQLVGAEDLIDLASLLVELDPLDARNSIRIEQEDGEKVVEEPALLREVWPYLTPIERVARYVAAIIFSNAFIGYYKGHTRVSINILLDDIQVASVTGILPVFQAESLDTSLLREFELQVLERDSIIGLSLVDPYNELWSLMTPSSKLVKQVLELRGIYIPLLKYGSKFELLYKGTIEALRESLSLSGLSLSQNEIDFSIHGGQVYLKIKGREIPETLFSKGLRTLYSVLQYCVASTILSAVGFSTVLYFDEPEASLDTYIVHILPLLLSKVVNDNLSIVVSTHREDMLVGFEVLKEVEEVNSDIIIYEFRYDENDGCFKPIPAKYDELLERFAIVRLQELEKRVIKLRDLYKNFLEVLKKLT